MKKDVFDFKLLNSEKLTADICTLVRLFSNFGFKCSDVEYQSEARRGLQLIEFVCYDMETAKKFADILSNLKIHFFVYNESFE